jgi:hypothetical protein
MNHRPWSCCICNAWNLPIGFCTIYAAPACTAIQSSMPRPQLAPVPILLDTIVSNGLNFSAMNSMSTHSGQSIKRAFVPTPTHIRHRDCRPLPMSLITLVVDETPCLIDSSTRRFVWMNILARVSWSARVVVSSPRARPPPTKMGQVLRPVVQSIWADSMLYALLMYCCHQTASDDADVDICEQRVGAEGGCRMETSVQIATRLSIVQWQSRAFLGHACLQQCRYFHCFVFVRVFESIECGATMVSNTPFSVGHCRCVHVHRLLVVVVVVVVQ